MPGKPEESGRRRRSKLVLLVGLPGSGKSTWCERNQVAALSSDATRRLLTGDENNQNVNRLIFTMLRRLAEARLKAGSEFTYIDSTALTERERRCWIRFAELHDCEIEAIYFDVPVEECKRRNAARRRVVPEEAMDRMAARITPPRVEEGFSRVSRVSAQPANPERG